MNKEEPIFRYSVPLCWYRGVYSDKARPCKAGRPFTLAHPFRPDAAILIVHGYTGYPGEVVRPARELYELGYDIYAPRLPGHGTSGMDFSRTGASDWIGMVRNAVDDLLEKYSNVFLAGHSMGAAIALIIAAEKNIMKTALIAPAVAPADASLPIFRLGLASLFSRRKRIPWQNDPGYSMYYEDAPADDLRLGEEYWSWLYYRQARDLYRIARKAMSAAPRLRGSVLIVSADEDALIPAGWTDALYEAAGGAKERTAVAGATHYMLYDKNKDAEEKAVRSVVSFFRP